MREWLDDGLVATKVAINISAHEIARPSFADEVAAVLREMTIDPRFLELELTESSIIGNLEEAARQMRKLRALGVRIAIDDFGARYSALAYLQSLPIDVLKIDRSFVGAITDASPDAVLVHAIMALARSLGLAVVAEGVETDLQLAALRDSRCDFLQGYLLSRPQPAAEVRQFLRPAARESRREFAMPALSYGFGTLPSRALTIET
jgi:EAL domain-containing protein (putative c-di-GMP-specific phosphodiesterase class I)